MNMKKTLVTAMAAAVAAMSVSAASVSATSLGESAPSVDFTVLEGQETVLTVAVDARGGGELMTIVATLPAGSLPAGDYVLNGQAVIDDAETASFVASQTAGAVDYCDIIDLDFATSGGEAVSPTNVGLVFNFANGVTYDAVYLKDGGAYVDLNAQATDTSISAVAPHCSRFVIAKLFEVSVIDDDSKAEEDTKTDNTQNGSTDTQNSTTPSNNNVKTGDDGNTTAVVFAVMSVVALATAFTAAKLKKNNK